MRSLNRLTVCLLIAALTFSGLDRPAGAASGTLMPDVKRTFVDNNGDPCSASCRVFWFAAGTSTKLTAYSDVGLTVALSNPTTLDSSGRIAAGGPFLTPGLSYKVILAPAGSDDPPSSPIWTQDNVSAVPPTSSAADTDVTATAGETISQGDAVFWSDGSRGNTTGRIYKADADFTDASNLAQAVGFATAAIATGSSGTVRRMGRFTGLTGLVAGTTYWVSATGGALTSTKPTNARVMGIADTTTSLILVPQDVDATSTLSGNLSTGTQNITGAKAFNLPPTFNPGTSSTAAATVSGSVFTDSTARANSGTTETDLSSTTLKGNALSANGKLIRVTAVLFLANTANQKTYKIYYGSSSIAVLNATTTANSFVKVEVLIMRTGASAQEVFSVAHVAGATPPENHTTFAIDTTADQTVKSTGQSNTASSDVQQSQFIVEVLG